MKEKVVIIFKECMCSQKDEWSFFRDITTKYLTLHCFIYYIYFVLFLCTYKKVIIDNRKHFSAGISKSLFIQAGLDMDETWQSPS